MLSELRRPLEGFEPDPQVDAGLAERDEGHDRQRVAGAEPGAPLELGRDLLDDAGDVAQGRVVVDADLGLESDDG